MNTRWLPVRDHQGVEPMLIAEGTILLKFCIHISDEERLRRFEAREDDPLKSWKLTDEDWRNRTVNQAIEAAIGGGQNAKGS